MEGKQMMAKTNRFGALVAMAGVTLVAVGLLGLMMLVVEVHPAEATFPGKNVKIAYVASDGHDRETFTIDPGGGNRVQVTHNTTQDESTILFTQRQADNLHGPTRERVGNLQRHRREEVPAHKRRHALLLS
jgi:hypothetical protein